MDKGIFNTMNNGLIQQFNQFRQTVQGDPKKQVMDLLQSGRMSNDQFQRLQQQANQFQRLQQQANQFQQMFNIK